MIQIIKACRACREILEDAGYSITYKTDTEPVDVCDVCGLRTGVRPIEIRKGKEAAECTGS